MKRRTLLSASALGAVALTGTGFAYASTREAKAGEIVTDLWMPSEILGIDVPYVLYLPEGYDPEQNYPVLYMLHGMDGRCVDWIDDGHTVPAFDTAIAEGRMPPTVGVFADGRRDPHGDPASQPRTYWMNDADGGFRYHDMFMEELLPHVASEHNAGGAKETTAIGGLSMGGFGALSFAMRNKDAFAATFAMSSGQRTEQQIIDLPMNEWNSRYGGAWGADLEGQDRLNDAFREWNLPDVLHREGDALNGTGYWLDCGDQDQFIEGNGLLDEVMTEVGVEHEYSTRPGGHNWEVWGEALPLGLDFIGAHFNG